MKNKYKNKDITERCGEWDLDIKKVDKINLDVVKYYWNEWYANFQYGIERTEIEKNFDKLTKTEIEIFKTNLINEIIELGLETFSEIKIINNCFVFK